MKRINKGYLLLAALFFNLSLSAVAVNAEETIKVGGPAFPVRHNGDQRDHLERHRLDDDRGAE